MNLNKSYNFEEAKLPDDFCEEISKKSIAYMNSSTSFTLVGMPAISTSLFLKYLASKNFGYFIYLDLYSLSTPSRREFFTLLLRELGIDSISSDEQENISLCKTQLKKLSQKHQKVVIIINRFEELQKEFTRNFFGTLRNLSHSAPNVSFIFCTTKPYDQTAPDALTGGNLQMFTEYLYFPPPKEKDLLLLLKLHSSNLFSHTDYFKKSVKLSGGHLQLLQLLLKTERKENPLLDPYIKLLLKELFSYLSPKQRRTIRNIALEKSLSDVDDYLIKVGLVKKIPRPYELFSPLFKEYLLTMIPLKLPSKELLLFRILKSNHGEIVSKEQLFNHLWKDNPDVASDWALDSLIYRLRKNPTFRKTGYIIENNKKLGYTLIKN